MRIERAATLPSAAGKADFSFASDERVVEPFDAVPLHVEEREPRRKSYGLEPALFEDNDGVSRALFLARDGDAVAGYLAASRGWNGCTFVDDVAVAVPFRRAGIARALMDEAVA